MKRLFQIVLLLAVIFTGLSPVFANDNMLLNSWNYYKKTFINSDGRVVDNQKGGITTSEAQSYALLRAIMVNDKSTFNKVYKWTKGNLYNQEYGLFSWLWGKNDNNWQILEKNTASDADIDIALSLILASKKWHNKQYLTDAKFMLNNIWERETVKISNMRVLAPGIEQAQAANIPINPSYFAPYAFKVFAKVDKSHNWNELVDSSYALTNQVNSKTKSGLPPDWFYIDSTNGEITLSDEQAKSDFSYDAVRTFLRFYVDYTLTKDQRALNLLSKVDIFVNSWEKEKKVYTNYKNTGELKDNNEIIGSIAAILPAIKLKDKNISDDIYQKKIKSHYKKAGYWNDPQDYYAQNLAWFGVWIYLNDTDTFKITKQILNK